MEYKIISSCFRDYLIDEINRMIKSGWEPLGGVTVGQSGPDTAREDSFVWAQAMTRPKIDH